MCSGKRCVFSLEEDVWTSCPDVHVELAPPFRSQVGMLLTSFIKPTEEVHTYYVLQFLLKVECTRNEYKK